MSTTKSIIIITSLVLSALSAFAAPGDGDPIAGVHPSYDMDTLLLPGLKTVGNDGFQPRVTGLAWLSDSTLVMTAISTETEQLENAFQGHAHKTPGYVYLLKGILENDPHPLELKVFSPAMTPLGPVIVNDSIYVQEWNALNLLVDDDGDRVCDRKVGVFTDFFGSGERNWSFCYLFKDGYFYMVPGVTMFGGIHRFPQTFETAGNMIKVARDGSSWEIFARGFRNPDGQFLGPEGEIFSTDDQGTWRPSSTLMHIKEGGYYGHYSHEMERDMEVSPGITYLPHVKISRSPHGPLYVKQGPFKGQVFFADCAVNNGINRIFLERVRGIYQGNAHHFTGDMLAGTHDVVRGADGNLYVGCIGNGDTHNWGWKNDARWGFHRLRPNGKTAFEMLAVRSMSDRSYEIEFTKPVSSLSTSNFEIRQWTYLPSAGYGNGNEEDNHSLNLTGVELNGDKTRAAITFAGGALIEGYMTHIRLVNVKSADGEDPWAAETWYQLNRFGPAEKPGCMNVLYEEFDPLAEYDPGSGIHCITPVVSVRKLPLDKVPEFYSTRTAEGVKIHLPFEGSYQVELRSMKGELRKQWQKSKACELSLGSGEFTPGLYIIQVKKNNQVYTSNFVLY